MSLSRSVSDGANPAEGEDEGVDSTVEKVINLVDAHRLCETGFDKKGFMTYIKGYMKSLKAKLEETNPDRVDPFIKEAQTFVKKCLGNFNEYQFFMGESMEPEAMVPLMYYAEDGMTIKFLFFADGVEAEKF